VGGSAAFVGREDVLRAVVRALAEPQNQGIVLYGQRRIGKTSILQHLVATLPERSGHRPVWFDLQDKAAESLDEVLADLASAIASALGLPDPAPGPEVETWFRDAWLPSVLDGLPAGVSLVLLFDEFDVLADVQAKQAASALFPYLRRLLEKNAPRLRAVFVIGRNIDDLENVAHALFKGLPSCHVSLLGRKDAEALVRLGEGNGSLTWSDAAVEAAWALTHGHPLLLQALCGHVWVHVHEERRPEDAGQAVTAAEVEEAVEPTLSGSRPAFEWLWKGLPPGKRIVAAALAQAGPEAISEEVLHRVLNENGVRVIIRELREAPRMLIEWDLLEAPAKGLYQFRVELLRRWIGRFKPLDQVQQDLDQIEPTAELLYRAAEGLYRAGNFDSAMARLQETLGLNPNHVRAGELLADILILRQDWAAARTVLERLYENQPAVGRARLVQVVLAQAEAAQGEDEQLKLFQRVREVEKNATAIAGIRRIWRARGDAARERGDLEAASAAYRAGGLEEQEAEIARDLREKKLAGALEEVRRLEQKDAHAEAFAHLRQLAEEYRDLRDWSFELARLEAAAEIEESYHLGVDSMRGGNKDKAAQLLAAVVARRPDYKDAVSLLHTLVTGVDAKALGPELRAEKEARRRTEAWLTEVQAALEAAKLSHEDARARAAKLWGQENEARRQAEAQLKEARAALEAAKLSHEDAGARAAKLREQENNARTQAEAQLKEARAALEAANASHKDARARAAQLRGEKEARARAVLEASKTAHERFRHNINNTVITLAVVVNILSGLVLMSQATAPFVGAVVFGAVSVLLLGLYVASVFASTRLVYLMRGKVWTILWIPLLCVPGISPIVLFVSYSQAKSRFLKADVDFNLSLWGPIPAVARRALSGAPLPHADEEQS
jgi:hypothetical protein